MDSIYNEQITNQLNNRTDEHLLEIGRRLAAGDFKIELVGNARTSAPNVDFTMGDDYYRATLYQDGVRAGYIWLHVGNDYFWFVRPSQFDEVISDMRNRNLNSLGGELLDNYWKQRGAYERALNADPEGAFGGRGTSAPFYASPVESTDVRNQLSEVITSAEASELFGIEQITVVNNIKRGNIPGRKSGGTWLILRADAEARWGNRGSQGGS